MRKTILRFSELLRLTASSIPYYEINFKVKLLLRMDRVNGVDSLFDADEARFKVEVDPLIYARSTRFTFNTHPR
jgi:hypothetical protein